MVALGEDGLKQHIKTIGLFNAKAKNVIAAVRNCSCAIMAARCPTTRDANSSALPGRRSQDRERGAEHRVSAQEAFAVDTHIFRVCNRTKPGARARPPRRSRQGLEKKVPGPFRMGAHHWLILHGRYVCKARRPECWRCPIVDLCAFRPKLLSPDAKLPAPKPSAAKPKKPQAGAKAA